MEVGTARTIKSIISSQAFCITPLQRVELLQLQRALEEEDERKVQRLYARVEAHFQELNMSLVEASRSHLRRYYIALDWFILMLNDHGLEVDQLEGIKRKEWILAYGDVEQQRQAAEVLTNGELEQLQHWRSTESNHFTELQLEETYVQQRLRAACANTMLSNQLLRNSDWDGLKALLNQDEAAYEHLSKYICFSTGFKRHDMSDFHGVLFQRINHLRAIMENPPEPEELPPAYDLDGSNVRPPAYPENVSTGLMDRVRIDRVLLRFRQAVSGYL